MTIAYLSMWNVFLDVSWVEFSNFLVSKFNFQTVSNLQPQTSPGQVESPGLLKVYRGRSQMDQSPKCHVSNFDDYNLLMFFCLMVTLKNIPSGKTQQQTFHWYFEDVNKNHCAKFWTKVFSTETERASPLPFLQQVLRRSWSEAWHATGETGWSRFKSCNCSLTRNGSVNAFFPVFPDFF